MSVCAISNVSGLNHAVKIREQLKKMMKRFKVKLVSCGCK